MTDDIAKLARIYAQTLNRLQAYSSRVQEGRDVVAASDFARWLNFSGILELLKAYPNRTMSHDPLKVDGAFLQFQCDQLIESCNERFRTNSDKPAIEAKEFQSMHEKIDRMAGYIAKLTAGSVIRVEPPPQRPVGDLNEFQPMVINGGGGRG